MNSILSKYGLNKSCVRYECDLKGDIDPDRYKYPPMITYKSRHNKSLINYNYYYNHIQYTVSIHSSGKIFFNVYEPNMMITAIEIFRIYYGINKTHDNL
jgi:hypothetical protein